jgi:general secretion pathway protein J
MKRPLSRGFTLIEVMVALVVMSVLALMSWQGVSGMASAQAITQARSDEVLQLQTALAQWQTDLDAVTDTQQVNPLEFNGVSLRMTRRDQLGNVHVTAWAARQSEGRLRWLRWQSVALNNRAELLIAWAQAAQWAQNPGDEERKREVAVTNIDQWQIYYFRNDAWTNPQSADASANTGAEAPGAAPGVPGVPRVTVPDGVRLVLTLSAGQSVSGVLTRDWVRPTLGGGKS